MLKPMIMLLIDFGNTDTFVSFLIVKALFLENLVAAGVAGAVDDVVLFNERLRP
jgi:hypothetical protein